MQAAFPDVEQFARFMRLLTDTKRVAARVFPKHREMFPGGLASMYALPQEFQEYPMNLKADYLQSNLEFLNELDQSDTTVQPHSQVCPQRPSWAHMQLPWTVPSTSTFPCTIESDLPSGSGMRTASISQFPELLMIPPVPESLSKGKWSTTSGVRVAEGYRRTNVTEFWNYCYTECHSNKKAFQMSHLNKNFSEKNPECQGHSKWLENKETLLYLFHAAGVKIVPQQTYLVKTLSKFWEENKVPLLKLLREWFQSGAAQSLQKSDVLHAALQHIRSGKSWWPNHGNDIDMNCLKDSVVPECRLLQES